MTRQRERLGAAFNRPGPGPAKQWTGRTLNHKGVMQNRFDQTPETREWAHRLVMANREFVEEFGFAVALLLAQTGRRANFHTVANNRSLPKLLETKE